MATARKASKQTARGKTVSAAAARKAKAAKARKHAEELLGRAIDASLERSAATTNAVLARMGLL